MFEDTSVYCDYGCGNEATHVFKNGSKCCSKYVVRCPAVREKISESLKDYYEVHGKSHKKVVGAPETDFFE